MKNLFLVLIVLMAVGCTTIPAHESVVAYEQFPVEKKCFDMIVLHVDLCAEHSNVCQGYVSPKGTEEVFYTILKKGTPEGGISQNCYIMRKDTGDIISQHLL